MALCTETGLGEASGRKHDSWEHHFPLSLICTQSECIQKLAKICEVVISYMSTVFSFSYLKKKSRNRPEHVTFNFVIVQGFPHFLNRIVD